MSVLYLYRGLEITRDEIGTILSVDGILLADSNLLMRAERRRTMEGTEEKQQF